MNLNKIMHRVHNNAVHKGWYEEGKVKSPMEVMACVAGELGEVIDCLKRGTPDLFISSEGKPEGQAAEIADILIYLFDYCEYHDIDLEAALEAKMSYNEQRPYRHGNKAY